MYGDLTTEELQAWLISQGISDDAILEDDATWQAAQDFRSEVQNAVYIRQCLYEADLTADWYQDGMG